MFRCQTANPAPGSQSTAGVVSIRKVLPLAPLSHGREDPNNPFYACARHGGADWLTGGIQRPDLCRRRLGGQLLMLTTNCARMRSMPPLARIEQSDFSRKRIIPVPKQRNEMAALALAMHFLLVIGGLLLNRPPLPVSSEPMERFITYLTTNVAEIPPDHTSRWSRHEVA